MPQLTFYINVQSNQLITSLSQRAVVDISTLPLNFYDTAQMKVYLLQPIEEPDPADGGAFPFTIVNNAGLQLFLYINDGTVGGTIYTQQIAWTADPTNTFFTANLALNTVALQTLLGSKTSAQAWLKIAYIQNGYQTTVLNKQVSIGVGAPIGSLVVPPGLTPLSVEVANNTYLPKQPQAGLAYYLESKAGKICALVYVDNPDSTASLQAIPVN